MEQGILRFTRRLAIQDELTFWLTRWHTMDTRLFLGAEIPFFTGGL
jgi:hypothetical protein